MPTAPEGKPKNEWYNQPAERLELLVGSPFKRERNRHIIVCNKYLQMGQGRSLSKLHQYLTETAQTHGGRVPTIRTLKQWSSDFDWVERGYSYDKLKREEEAEVDAEVRRKYLTDGLALPHNRINRLSDVEELLYGQIMDHEQLWPPEKKNIREADGTWVIVETRKFNGAIVQQWRGILDDIAKEVGDRKERVLHGGDPDAPGLEMNLTTHLDTMRQIKERAAEELDDFDPYDGDTGKDNPFDEPEA